MSVASTGVMRWAAATLLAALTLVVKTLVERTGYRRRR